MKTNFLGFEIENSIFLSFNDSEQNVLLTLLEKKKDELPTFKDETHLVNYVRKIAKLNERNSDFWSIRKSDNELWENLDAIDSLNYSENLLEDNNFWENSIFNEREKEYMDHLLDGNKKIDVCHIMNISERTGRYINSSIVKKVKGSSLSSDIIEYRKAKDVLHSKDIADLRYRKVYGKDYQEDACYKMNNMVLHKYIEKKKKGGAFKPQVNNRKGFKITSDYTPANYCKLYPANIINPIKPAKLQFTSDYYGVSISKYNEIYRLNTSEQLKKLERTENLYNRVFGNFKGILQNEKNRQNLYNRTEPIISIGIKAKLKKNGFNLNSKHYTKGFFNSVLERLEKRSVLKKNGFTLKPIERSFTF